MGAILNILGMGLIGASLWCVLLQKPQKAMVYAYLFMISDFNLNQYVDYNSITKLIMLIILMFAVFQHGLYRYIDRRQVFLYIFIFIAIIAYFENRNNQYSFSDFILSLLTILLGVLALHIKWDDKVRVKFLKLIAWSSILCVVCGVLKDGTLITESGRIVSGTVLYHSPAWMGLSGMFASMLLVEAFECEKYNKFIIINFMLVCLTQMRGGIIFAVILITPYLINQLKNMSRMKVIVLSIFIPITLLAINEVFVIFMERTFVDGTINTSGRFDAWPYFLALAKEKIWMGHGIGSIKTMTETEIYKRGFRAAHNEYIRLLVETGISGLVCFVLYMSCTVKKLYNNTILQSKKVYYIAFVIGFIVLSGLDNTISGHISWVPFCLLLSLASGMKVSE